MTSFDKGTFFMHVTNIPPHIYLKSAGKKYTLNYDNIFGIKTGKVDEPEHTKDDKSHVDK